ncbi:glutamate--cysteine ligase regulatory subunit-like [Tubulanus polymorphus]|uniref:glutamate--cysteine ligase regulatory subunit-like n=1 Tax=Tubulanus polymorphus TaxID=672921 RepID=UPI003DA3A679
MAEIPVFPKAESIIIHTGNMVNWSRLKRKPNQQATEELLSGIDEQLQSCKRTLDLNDVQYLTRLECKGNTVRECKINLAPNAATVDCNSIPCPNEDTIALKFSNEDRDNLKITVKVYLHECTPESLSEAVEKVMESLGTTYLETLLVALPENITQDFSLEAVKPVWSQLEKLVQDKHLIHIGFSDLNKQQLEQVYDWATEKPSIDQVNLASCCVMPQDLVDFAKLNLIQLLSHNDPKDILPAESFRKKLQEHFTQADSDNWQPYWTVRYSGIVKGRGVIHSKGYITKAIRDIKNRK